MAAAGLGEGRCCLDCECWVLIGAAEASLRPRQVRPQPVRSASDLHAAAGEELRDGAPGAGGPSRRTKVHPLCAPSSELVAPLASAAKPTAEPTW